MFNSLVTPDKFNITPAGILRKPTDAAYIPSPANTLRLGSLANQRPGYKEYSIPDVQRIMVEFWEELVINNPELFTSDD
jgi:hypothetical protein